MHKRTDKSVLVLGASLYQLKAITTAKRLGYRVITADNVPANPGHQRADACFNIDTTDRHAILDLAGKEQIDGIIAVATDVAVPTAAYVAEHLNLPGVPLGSAEILCDKARFRRFQQEHGFPVPAFCVCTGAAPPDERLFRSPPVIMKPDRSSGSKGVFIVSSLEAYRHRLPETLRFSPTGTAVLETYLEGFQGTLEGIVRDGQLCCSWVLDRQTVGAPYTATCGHRVPTRLKASIQAQVRAQIQRLCALLNLTDTVFDCDFVATDSEVFLLEVSPRVGGNAIATLLERAYRIDLIEYALQAACGDAPAVPTATDPPTPCAIVLLGTPAAGRLDYDTDQAARLAAQPWVDALHFDVERGDPVAVFKNGRHRVGQALIHAATRDELDQSVRLLREKLRVSAVQEPVTQ